MGWWGYKPDETDGFYNIKKSFKVLNKKTISENFEAFLTNTEYERLDRLYFYLGFWDYLKTKKKALLEVLKEGNKLLFEEACRILEDSIKKLGLDHLNKN